MKVIDTHQHFWKYNVKDYDWIDDKSAILRNDFLPQELKQIYDELGIDGSISVQATRTAEEIDWLLELANKYSFIKGVIGWIDFKVSLPELLVLLKQYKKHPKLLGFREVIQGAPDEDYLKNYLFVAGVNQLVDYGFCYELLIFAHQLPAAIQFVSKLDPRLPMMLDHIAKPVIHKHLHTEWAESIHKLATFSQVYVKVSGMVTEADWEHWQENDFTPYFKTIKEAFGVSRICFGSDWPVCTLAAEYTQVKKIVANFFSTPKEYEQVFGKNAERFYFRN